MANVSIKFNNKEFLLSCEDGQEEHLEELLIHINQKFNDLKKDLGNIGENKLLLITSVKIMDEYFETKKKIDLQKKGLQCIIICRPTRGFPFRNIYEVMLLAYITKMLRVYCVSAIKSLIDLLLTANFSIFLLFFASRLPST